MHYATAHKSYYLGFTLVLFLFCIPIISRASTSNGTISASAYGAWSNNIGWVNFAPANGGVIITDSALTGSAWSGNYGWINFAPSNGGVMNDGQGHLSGSAWGDNLGWIDFSGVSINSNGKFTGTASGTIIGILTFDCTYCDVETDWRPLSVRNGLSSFNSSYFIYPSVSLQPTSTPFFNNLNLPTFISSTTPVSNLYNNKATSAISAIPSNSILPRSVANNRGTSSTSTVHVSLSVSIKKYVNSVIAKISTQIKNIHTFDSLGNTIRNIWIYIVNFFRT